jgi:hypothetical protein
MVSEFREARQTIPNGGEWRNGKRGGFEGPLVCKPPCEFESRLPDNPRAVRLGGEPRFDMVTP